MKKLGEYHSYLLYVLDECDVLDINNSNGSRYIRNSILIFKTSETTPKLGDEWRISKNENEAKKIIDEERKKSIDNKIKIAIEKSREQQLYCDEERKRKENHYKFRDR